MARTMAEITSVVIDSDQFEQIEAQLADISASCRRAREMINGMIYGSGVAYGLFGPVTSEELDK